jgi:hypothetical protein
MGRVQKGGGTSRTMTGDSERSKVPPELAERIKGLKKETSGGDPASSIPGDVPEVCPECGGQLTFNATFADEDGAVAVRLTCRTPHEQGRIATYLYAVDQGELYLEDESEPGEEHGGRELDGNRG